MMNAKHAASTDASISPNELVPWYIIVSKLALAMGTSMAMLAGG